MSRKILFDYPDNIKTFVNCWRDVCERFVSGLWHDPAEGRRASVAVGLTTSCFPDPRLLALARVIIVCGIKGYEPETGFIASVMHDLGESIAAPDLEVIRWRHCCAAGTKRYAALLIDFDRRRAFHDLIERRQSDALDAYERVGDVAARILDDIHGWRVGGSNLSEPPKLTRPSEAIARRLAGATA